MDIESSKKVFNEQNEAFWSYMSKKQEIDELVRLSERRPPQVPMRDSGQSMDIEKTPEPVSPNQIETCNGVFLRCGKLSHYGPDATFRSIPYAFIIHEVQRCYTLLSHYTLDEINENYSIPIELCIIVCIYAYFFSPNS